MVVFLRYLLLAFLVLIPALFLYLLYQRRLLLKRKGRNIGKDKDEAALNERLRTLVFLFILVIILIVVLSGVA